MTQLLTYGLQNGKLIHISEVSNGLASECVCPHCKRALIAKNNPNNKKESHFAHYSTMECKGAVETALHLLAKEVMLNTKKMFLPDYHYDYIPENELSIYNEGKSVEFDEIVIEKSIEIDGKHIISDVVGVKNNKQILIEFANSHFIDEDKIQKIKNINLPCVEINLKGQILDKQLISDFLNSRNPQIYWVINQRFDLLYEQEKKREKEEEKILQQKSEQEKIDNPLKFEKYKTDKNVRVLVINKGTITCPVKIKNLKQTSFYENQLLKRIIDGEFWNGIIYKDYSTESIYLNGKKIELSSQKEWTGLIRMQLKIPNWECEKNDENCNFCEINNSSYERCCFKCNYFVDKFDVGYKRYVICKFSCLNNK